MSVGQVRDLTSVPKIGMVKQGGARTPVFYAGAVLWAGFCAGAAVCGLGSGERGGTPAAKRYVL